MAGILFESYHPAPSGRLTLADGNGRIRASEQMFMKCTCFYELRQRLGRGTSGQLHIQIATHHQQTARTRSVVGRLQTVNAAN